MCNQFLFNFSTGPKNVQDVYFKTPLLKLKGGKNMGSFNLAWIF